MCARRNPDSHVRLLGPSTAASGIAKWQGHYPKGLSYDEYSDARSLRRLLLSQGMRAADVVDVIEETFGRMNTTPPKDTYANKVPLTDSAAFRLKELLTGQWSGLRWHRELTLLKVDFELAELGTIDLVAGDTTATTAVLIELQLDRDDVEVVDTIDSYLGLFRHAPDVEISFEGAIVVSKFSEPQIQRASALGIKLFGLETSLTKQSDPENPTGLRLTLQRLN